MKGITFICFLTLFSCSKSEKTRNSIDYSSFLDKFQEIKLDTLLIFSESFQKAFGELAGVQLDTSDTLLLPPKLRWCKYSEIFACYKFSIDSVHVGLIARTCGMYVPSSIKILVFEKDRGISDSFYEVADSWGDAGVGSDLRSWLFLEKPGDLRSFTFHKTSFDHRIDDPNDSTVDYKYEYSLVRYSNSKFDTVSLDSSKLVREFGSLLK